MPRRRPSTRASARTRPRSATSASPARPRPPTRRPLPRCTRTTRLTSAPDRATSMAMTWTPIVDRARITPVLADIAAAIESHPREHHADLVDYAVFRSYLDADGAVPDPDDRAGE